MHGAHAYQATTKRLTDKDGRALPGLFAEPRGACVGAMLLLHDFFGLTPFAKSQANKLAANGYLVFAPDLYRGEVATTRERAADLAKRLGWNQIAKEMGLAVLALRNARPGIKVGALGFAMGGAAALVAAATVPDLAAAVTFYGIPQDVVVADPRIRVQGHFARHDQKCTEARVTDFAVTLHSHGVRFDAHHYDADNGFLSVTRPDVYRADCAELAWSRTTTFLREALA